MGRVLSIGTFHLQYHVLYCAVNVYILFMILDDCKHNDFHFIVQSPQSSAIQSGLYSFLSLGLATETQPGVSCWNNPTNPHFIDISLLIPSISISGTSRQFTPALCSGRVNFVSPNQCVMHPQYPHLLNEILPDGSSQIYDSSFEPSATVTTRSDRGKYAHNAPYLYHTVQWHSLSSVGLDGSVICTRLQ